MEEIGFSTSHSESETSGNVSLDFLGPFSKMRRENMYIVVGIGGFTKLLSLRAVESIKTIFVMEYFNCHLVTDHGSSLSSKSLQYFCAQSNIKHSTTAVATKGAVGQTERRNRTMRNDPVRNVEFSTNTSVNKSVGKTPSQLLFGFMP